MPIELGVIIVSSLVSNAIGSVFGNFFNRFGSGDRRTLETFLATLSTDFVHRVESVIRDAFTSQNFLEVKIDITTAATAFRTFQASQWLDGAQLDTACNCILAARSRLFAVTREICAFADDIPGNIAIADPKLKGAKALQYSRAVEASIAALQAIAALDLLILAKKTEKYPTLKVEIVSRVKEYTKLADQLKNHYVSAQSFRQWVKRDHSIRKIFSGPGGGFGVGFGVGGMGTSGVSCHLKAIYYRDGNVITQMESKYSHVSRDQAEALEKTFDGETARDARKKWVIPEDKGTIYDAAKRRLNSDPGNIKEAVETWEAVRAVFAD